MKKYLENWKTTSAGIISIVSGVAMYISDKTKIVESLSLLLAGIGLIFAGDAKPTEPTA
jgi:uncharacterized membrane protein HdeD (DUF308 family)